MKNFNLVFIAILLTSCGPSAHSKVDACYLTQGETSATIVCTNGITSVVNAGLPGPVGPTGAEGPPGPTPTLGPDTPVSLIAPCGNASSPWKEQLMCLNNGSLLGSFSNDMAGDSTRFSLIPPGTYEDTDQSGCVFTVALSSDGVSTMVNWTDGSNQYSTWHAQSVLCQAN